MGVKNIRAHQLLMLEMLGDFDRVCKKHGIAYTLFAGTALGAVRHQGFIPWDDDLDVIMLREDYERFFREAAGDFDPTTYYVQKEFSKHWPMFFSKLRRNGTACMEKYHPKDDKTHQGVYLDIFPCDNLSDNKWIGKLQFWASKVVIAKGLSARGYETDSKGKKLFMALCRLLPHKPLWNLCVLKNGQGSMVHSFLGGSSKYEKSIYERKWFTETENMSFEGQEFPVSRHCDALLARLYGDYMEIPPQEELEKKEHAMIVDLDRSWEHYLEQQKQAKPEHLLRSVR